MHTCIEIGTKIAEELVHNLEQISSKETSALIDALLHARTIFFAGCGRSLLMIRCFAMRMMHMGLPVYVVGETVTPAIQPGDLLVIGSGSGQTASLQMMALKAKQLNVSIALLTIDPLSEIAKLADFLVVIPGTSGKMQGKGTTQSIQPGGNLFEQTIMLLGDSISLCVAERLGLKLNDDMIMKRHANLE